MSLLRVQHLTKRFGGLIAVNDVSFDVEEGEILSVIGPNGAGKSTLFKLIASFVKPTTGQVLFKGERDLGPKRRTSWRATAWSAPSRRPRSSRG